MAMLIFSMASILYLFNCNELFLQRAERMSAALEAATCYQSAIQTAEQSGATNEQVEDLYSKLSLSHAWVVLRTKNQTEKRTAIDAGLSLSEQMLNSKIPTAEYWRSVFVTFDCQDRDGNTMLPRCMFRNLGYLQSLMLTAQKKSPAVHGYGPDRVYGIMYLEMPRVVGGSYAIAYEHIKKAYENAPKLTMNGLYYARVLIKLNKVNEAREVLNQVITLKPENFDSDSIPETLDDQIEAQKILSTLN